MVFKLVLKSEPAALPMVFSQDKRVMHQFVTDAPRDHLLAVLLYGARGDANLHLVFGEFLCRVLKPHASKRWHMPVQHQPRGR